MQYKLVARLLDNRKCIGYRLIGEDNSVKHFGMNDVMTLAKQRLLVNAQLVGNNLMGVGVNLASLEAIEINVKKEEPKKQAPKSVESNSRQTENKSRTTNETKLVAQILDLDLNVIGYLLKNNTNEKFISVSEIGKYTNSQELHKLPKQILCREIFDQVINRLHQVVNPYKSNIINGKIYYQPKILRGGRNEIDYCCVVIDLNSKKCEYEVYRKLIKDADMDNINNYENNYMKIVYGSVFEFDILDGQGGIVTKIRLDVAKNKQVR